MGRESPGAMLLGGAGAVVGVLVRVGGLVGPAEVSAGLLAGGVPVRLLVDGVSVRLAGGSGRDEGVWLA